MHFSVSHKPFYLQVLVGFLTTAKNMGLVSAKKLFSWKFSQLETFIFSTLESYVVSNWKRFGAKRSLGREKYWNVFCCLKENFSGTGFISFTLLKFLLVLLLLRLCFGCYPDQKFPEMVCRMKASTRIYYFVQISKGLRLGCQSVPSEKTDLAALLVAIVGILNPKLMDVFPDPSPSP